MKMTNARPAQKRILVADDMAAIRRTIERTLTRAGFEVTAVEDGQRAVALARERSFDVAIVDQEMPPPKGTQVLAILRDLQPDCVRLLVTGERDIRVLMEAVNRGEISRSLAKPFEPEELVRAVEEALAMRERVAGQFIARQARNYEHERDHFRELIDDGHVQLALQPIVEATTGRALAFESLLRSTHHTLNGPGPVLAAAERHDLLTPLTAAIMKRAAARLREIPDETKLFINLHPRDLEAPEVLQGHVQLLQPWADRVVLEITERSDVLKVGKRGQSIALLREMGFLLAVDDLGAGYNSLTMLAEFEPNYIKIDMSIVRDVDKSPVKSRLIDMVIGFAQASNSQVVAEGIETEAEASTLEAKGIGLFQGYWFGKPMLDIAQVLDFVASRA